MLLRIYEIFDAKLLVKSGVSVVEHTVTFANQASFQPEEKTIEFEGSGTTSTVYLQSKLTAELQADAWPLDVLNAIYGDTAVTAGLPAGVARRQFFGKRKQSGVKAGLKVTAVAINDADSTTRIIDIIVPVGLLSAVQAPSLQSGNKAPMKVKLAAEQTAKDLAGTAIVGLAAGEVCTWFFDVHNA